MRFPLFLHTFCPHSGKKNEGEKNKQIMDQTSKENPNTAAQNLFFFFSNPHSQPSYSTVMYKSSGYVWQPEEPNFTSIILKVQIKDQLKWVLKVILIQHESLHLRVNTDNLLRRSKHGQCEWGCQLCGCGCGCLCASEVFTQMKGWACGCVRQRTMKQYPSVSPSRLWSVAGKILKIKVLLLTVEGDRRWKIKNTE